MISPVRVVGAAESAARDAAAIASGTPGRELMRRAGLASAAELQRRFGDRLWHGVAVFAGPGNNGGDAWVVAGALAAEGVPVRVVEAAPPRTPEAIAEREAARKSLSDEAPSGREWVVVDGMLGTGASGAPRGAIADAVARIAAMRAAGAVVVSLDIPSGLDATTGAADGSVVADLTLTFGAMKRGLLLRRGVAGAIAVLDIGLGAAAEAPSAPPPLIDAAWVAARVPPIAAESHKGSRRRVAIIGGAAGMAGAAVLAARGAVRSGVGMVRLVVAPASLSAVQSAVVEATAVPWPAPDADLSAIVEWAHALLIGPGLSATPETRALVERLLGKWKGPVVLDADALNLFAGDAPALGRLLGGPGRSALVTPHVSEFARLASGAGNTVTPDEVQAARFDIGRSLAKTLGAVVLLKGVPTVLTAPDGRCLVSAAGSPVLAAAGSGDLLSGIAVTLLAQMGDPLESAACAAWVHGRAGELAAQGRSVRGVTLDEVTAAVARSWAIDRTPPPPPLLAELPAVGDAP